MISTFNNITISDDVIEEIAQFANTLMRGIQTFKNINRQYKNIGDFDFDVVINDLNATISRISFVVNKPDEYGIIFGANGVYIDILEENWFVNVKDDVFFLKVYFDATEGGILIAFYFIVLVFANKMFKGYTLLIAIILTIFYILEFDMKIIFLIVYK